MCVARYYAAGSEGYVEFEGSRGCRLRMVVGFARLEGLRGWRTNYLRRRCPVDLCVCVCVCVCACEFASLRVPLDKLFQY